MSGEERVLSERNVARSDLLLRRLHSDGSLDADLPVPPQAFDAWVDQKDIDDMDIPLLMQVVKVRAQRHRNRVRMLTVHGSQPVDRACTGLARTQFQPQMHLTYYGAFMSRCVGNGTLCEAFLCVRRSVRVHRPA